MYFLYPRPRCYANQPTLIYKKSAKIWTTEAKTVKTTKKDRPKLLKSTKSCDFFEPLREALKKTKKGEGGGGS